MGIKVDEQETTINFQRNGEYAIICTSDTTVMNRLDKLAANEAYPRWSLSNVVKDQDGNIVFKYYKVDKKLISFRANRSHREMSEDRRQASIIRMQEYHARKKMQDAILSSDS